MSRKPAPRNPAPSRATSARASPRPRHDGWTPERKLAFIDALAASGCVTEACAAVGVSRTAAYALRVLPEARQFRMAWDAAQDLAIRRLADECYSRALAGVAVPHFFKGEVVGEHRRYDTRLAMFLLRYRDPLRYAASLDEMVYSGHPEGAGTRFAHARNAVLDEAHGVPDGEQLSPDPPYDMETPHSVAARQAEERVAASPGPVHGTADRRQRIHDLRAQMSARDRAEADAAAGDAAADDDAFTGDG